MSHRDHLNERTHEGSIRHWPVATVNVLAIRPGYARELCITYIIPLLRHRIETPRLPAGCVRSSILTQPHEKAGAHT